MGDTRSKLDLPSLTPPAAGCGQLQLGTVQWGTSVTLLQVVDNWPHKIMAIGSPLAAPGQRSIYFYYFNHLAKILNVALLVMARVHIFE